jgi:hypothetical protein
MMPETLKGCQNSAKAPGIAENGAVPLEEAIGLGKGSD